MNEPKKIVYVIDELNIGGTEKQLLAIIDRIDRSRFEPILICLRPTSYFNQCDLSCEKMILEVGSLVSFNGLKKLLGFFRYLRRNKVDIVQTFFFDSTVFGVLAAKLAGVKKIISCRRDMGFWYTTGLLFVLRPINLLTDRILVNSEAIKNNVCRRENVSSERMDVIYNGIDLAPFAVKHDVETLRATVGIPSNDFVVGIVANLNRQVKRVDLFIDAAAYVLKEMPNTSFVIVGDGHLRKSLEYQAVKRGVSEKIYFVGSQKNVIPYLQLFDIGVLTSESEGFSNSIIEYMAAGLPVVCFDSGGNREVVEDGVTGLVSGIFSSKNLSRLIDQLMIDEQSRHNMGNNNIERIKKYSWKPILNDLYAIYDS